MNKSIFILIIAVLSCSSLNAMGSWSGYNRFLTDINEDQIENLDNIL